MENITLRIKEYAYSLGFDACGICKAEEVDLTTAESYKQWLELGYEANMDYQTRNTDKRLSPTLLVEGAKSIISLALNYYPQQMQEKSAPQFAYYAYGKDYHDVMKTKLNQLLQFIQQIVPETLGRVFCDTAPLWRHRTL